MSDTKAAVCCIRLFNLDVKIMVLGKIIYYISLSFWSRYISITSEHSGMVPFLYL